MITKDIIEDFESLLEKLDECQELVSIDEIEIENDFVALMRINAEKNIDNAMEFVGTALKVLRENLLAESGE